MFRPVIVALTVWGLSTAVLADERPEPPGAEELTIIPSRWVSGGKVAVSMTRIAHEKRKGVRTVARIVGGMRVAVPEEYEYTVAVPMMVAVEADIESAVDSKGGPLSAEALAARLKDAKPVLVASMPLDPAFRQILKEDAVILASPNGLSDAGATGVPRWLPRVTLASILERDGELKLYLTETQVSRRHEKRVAIIEGKAVERVVEAAVRKNVTREMIFDGVAIQACDMKGDRIGSRQLRKRLKEWTPVLVMNDKPEANYLETFKEDTVVLLLPRDEPKALDPAAGGVPPPVPVPTSR
jgi:hypothetical protein